MKIKLPNTISGWCMWLFFLCYATRTFVKVNIVSTVAPILEGLFAIGYLIAVFFGK